METQKDDTANAELDDFFIIFAHTTWWHLEKWIEAGELSVMPYLRANFDEQEGHQVQFGVSVAIGQKPTLRFRL